MDGIGKDVAGSNPVTVPNKHNVAQWIEHLVFYVSQVPEKPMIQTRRRGFKSRCCA